MLMQKEYDIIQIHIISSGRNTNPSGRIIILSVRYPNSFGITLSSEQYISSSHGI